MLPLLYADYRPDFVPRAYGFALPSLPSVNGREFVGKVVDIHDRYLSKFATGDTVSAPFSAFN